MSLASYLTCRLGLRIAPSTLFLRPGSIRHYTSTDVTPSRKSARKSAKKKSTGKPSDTTNVEATKNITKPKEPPADVEAFIENLDNRAFNDIVKEDVRILAGLQPKGLELTKTELTELANELRSLPPDKIEDGCWEEKDDINEFRSVVLQQKRTVNMKRAGRTPTMQALVMVGNGQGVGGFAVGKAIEVSDAVEKATKKAAKRLYHIDRFEDRTIHHSVRQKFCKTTIHMRPAPKGYGMTANHTMMQLCELVGINDIIVDVMGRQNQLNLLRTAFMAFGSQRPVLERAGGMGKCVLRYFSPEFPPALVAVNPRVDPYQGTILARSLPREVTITTNQWLRKFPLDPSAENWKLARAVRRVLLRVDFEIELRQKDFLESQKKGSVQGLNLGADLLGSLGWGFQDKLEQKDPALMELIKALRIDDKIPLLLEAERCIKSYPDICSWIRAMPLKSDPSFTVMYPNHPAPFAFDMGRTLYADLV